MLNPGFMVLIQIIEKNAGLFLLKLSEYESTLEVDNSQPGDPSRSSTCPVSPEPFSVLKSPLLCFRILAWEAVSLCAEKWRAVQSISPHIQSVQVHLLSFYVPAVMDA